MKVHAGPFRARKNQTLDYILLPFNCLYFIKICAYSHVTVIPAAVIDYQIKVTKYFDSESY